jgi:hypothetical protein
MSTEGAGGEGHDPTRPPPSELPPALSVPRPDEAAPADELTSARNWLTYLRAGAVFKLEDLEPDQLRWRPAPTANSMGTIVVHLGLAERLWVRAIWAGEGMDMAWRRHMFDPIPDGWTADDVVAFYRTETAAVDAVLDGVGSLDAPSAAPFRPTTLRWVLVHLIEETARHLGHLDITRELLDGRVGR